MNFRPLVAVIVVAIVVSTSVYVVIDTMNSCELTYDTNGGTFDEDTVVHFKKGGCVHISDSVPTMKGYRFSGWSEDRFAYMGDINAGSCKVLNKSTTLYAIWVPCGNVVMLSDAGLDDAIALCHLFRCKELFDSITVIAVAGNGPQSQCLTNIRKVVEICNVQNDVKIVSTNNIEQNHGNSSPIHGNDYLGDIYTEMVPTVPYIEYEDWIKDVGRIDHLVSAGGCTVTEMILNKIDVTDFILMAGFIECDPFYGDYEFNQMMDPKAYGACLKYEHKDVTIDTGTCEGLDVIDWNVTGDTPVDRFFAIYQKNCIDAKDASIAIWDDIAVTCLLHPHHFTTEEVIDPHDNLVTNLVFIGDRYVCSVHHE